MPWSASYVSLSIETARPKEVHTFILASSCSLHFSRSQLTSALPRVYTNGISYPSYHPMRYLRLTTPAKPTCCSCLNPSGWPIFFFEMPAKLVRFEFRLNFAPIVAAPTPSSPVGSAVAPRPPSLDEIWRESRRPAVRMRPAAVDGVKSRELWAWPWLLNPFSGKSIIASRGTPTHKRLRIMVYSTQY